ncbi:MAG: HTH-type transcriptional regulator PuuR [Candidatus Celerinatantimonas neptuna]|nr:MAG: HTH-type transcriptional regulator PuuR [Candidatus Celerinatantimonas neptuna]
MDVGHQLKTIRLMRGLSQRQLARQSGVTNSMISQIEQGLVNPSVGSLKKILDAIPISMGEFFTLEFEEQPKYFFKQDELTDLGDGQIEMLLVGSRRRARKLAMIHEIYPPGSDTGQDMMSHEGEECGIIIKGSIEITIADQTQGLSAGEAYYFNTHQPHRFRNISDEPCELISAATPPTF